MHGAVSFHEKCGSGEDEEMSERLWESKINQFGGNLLLWILPLVQKFLLIDYYILEILLGNKT